MPISEARAAASNTQLRDPWRRDPAARSRRRPDGRPPGRERGDPPPPRRGSRVGSGSATGSRSSGRDPRTAAWSRCESPSRSRRSATGSEPAARSIRTGDVGEADEAKLVVARGAIVASARRSSTGTVYFEIDDGSGPLRVTPVGQPCAPTEARSWPAHGSRCVGVLGQETSRIEAATRATGSGRAQPPRCGSPRRSPPVGGSAGSGGSAGPAVARGGPDRLARRPGDRRPLPAADRRDARRRSVDGDAGRRAALGRNSPRRGRPLVGRCVVARLTRERRPPFALDLGGLQAMGSEPVTGVADRQARRRGRPDGGPGGRARAAACRRSPATCRPGSRWSVGWRARPRAESSWWTVSSSSSTIAARTTTSGGATARGRHRSRDRRAPAAARRRAAASDRHRASSQAPRARGSATPRTRPGRRSVRPPPTSRRMSADRSWPACCWWLRSSSLAAQPSDADARPTAR